MSSLLKALKQEQSPLASQSSQIDPQLLDSGSASSTGHGAVWRQIAVTLIVIASVVVSAWLLWTTFSAEPNRPSVSTDYAIGNSSDLPQLSWPAEQPKATDNPTVTEQQVAQTTTEPSNRREPLNMNEVSASLLAKFEQAVQQTQASDPAQQSMSVVPALTELNADFQSQVQPFSYDGHMYVSAEQRRWVELNNQRLYVGDRYQNMVVTRIEPQLVVLSLQGKAFSVEALSDWQPNAR